MARGSIRWKDSRGGWEVQVSAGTDPEGKRRRQTRLVRGTEADAEKVLTQMLAALDSRTVGDSTATVAQLLEMWWAAKTSRDAWAPKTAHEYRRIIDRRLMPRWGRVRLCDLRRADLLRWHDELHETGVSSATVNRFHGCLRAALSFAVERELIAANPAAGKTHVERERRKEMEPPSPADLERVLAVVDGHDPELGRYLRVAAWCGLRRGEMSALRWRDVDLEAGELRVRRSISQIGSSMWEKDTKTHQRRRLALGGETVRILVAHRESQRSVGVPVDSERFVWTRGGDGVEPVPPDVVTAAWARYRDQADVSCRLHDLRHYMATQMLEAGVPVKTVQERLGHSLATTTLNIYSHAIKSRDRDAAEAIEQLSGRGMPDGDG